MTERTCIGKQVINRLENSNTSKNTLYELLAYEYAHDYSMEKLEEMNAEVQSKLKGITSSDVDYLSTVNEKKMIDQAKQVKPELDRLKLAHQKIKEGQYDKAELLTSNSSLSGIGFILNCVTRDKIKDDVDRDRPLDSIFGRR